MTLKERIIVTAYTGMNLLKPDEMYGLYQYASSKLGYQVYTHMMATETFWKDLREKSREDFIGLAL